MQTSFDTPSVYESKLAPIASFEAIDSLSTSPTTQDNFDVDSLLINKSIRSSKNDINKDENSSFDKQLIDKIKSICDTNSDKNETKSQKVDLSTTSKSSSTISLTRNENMDEETNEKKQLDNFSPTKSQPSNTPVAVNYLKKNSQGSSTGAVSQIVSFFQNNAQRLSKRLSDAIVSPKLVTKTFENSTIKKPLGNVPVGVVITSARSSRRRLALILANLWKLK